MSKEYEITIQSHPSIYSSDHASRELKICFNEPSTGMNEDTGLLLLIPGFGEHMNDRINQEARTQLSDQHNVVTIQCEYFGQEFMQENNTTNYKVNIDALQQVFTPEEFSMIYDGQNINMDQIWILGSKYNIHLEGMEILNETYTHFNDMGIMQAIDNLTALLTVSAILADNGYSFNRSRVYAYGRFHGAYLAYLCNAFAPSLFSCIIDSSAWLLPPYLKNPRMTGGYIDRLSYSVIFNYLAGSMAFDKELLHLPSLYKHFRNKARIISFHRSDDTFLKAQYKRDFCQSVKNCKFQEVTSQNENDLPLKASEHGLHADFVGLFGYAMTGIEASTDPVKMLSVPNVRIETNEYRYQIDYSAGFPHFSRLIKKRAGLLH
jgi:hypothetical protein